MQNQRFRTAGWKSPLRKIEKSMRFYFNIILSAFLIINLNCTNNVANKPISVQSDSTSVKATRGQPLLAGKYGNIAICIDSNSQISGSYEYYDKWNESFSEFMNICKFYFLGRKVSDSVFLLDIFESGKNGKMEGKLLVNGKDSGLCIALIYPDGPLCFSEANFEIGVTGCLNANFNWLEERLIDDKQVFLYSQPNEHEKLKSFLIRGDNVKIVEYGKDGWVKVSYSKFGDYSRQSFYWIKENSLERIGSLQQ